MDTAEITVLLGGSLLIVLTLWFFFGARDEAPRAKNNKLLYACPMHSWVTSTNPGAHCSICGMKLMRANELTRQTPSHEVQNDEHH
jgi:hypothetical protein